MNKKNMGRMLLSILICLVPLIIGLIIYNDLPDEMAVHWGFSNKPNGFAHKQFVVIGMPLLIAIFQVVTCFAINYDKKTREDNKKMAFIATLIFPIISIAVMSAIYLYALDYNINVKTVAFALISFILILIGNYLPKTRTNIPNSRKTSKNISVENNFYKINRYIGYILVFFGFLFLLGCFLDDFYSYIILVVFLIVSILGSLYLILKEKFHY